MLIRNVYDFGLNCDITGERGQFSANKRNTNVKTDRAKHNLEFSIDKRNNAERTVMQL